MMNISVPAIIVIAMIICGGFALLKVGSGSSSEDEIEAAHRADARFAKQESEAHQIDGSNLAIGSTEMMPLPSRAEAMILPLGVPVEAEFATFEGSLHEARQIVSEMADTDRARVAIWTPGHIFTADGLLHEIPGHEHDRLHKPRPI